MDGFDLLADRVSGMTWAFPGAREHVQIKALMTQAERYVLDDELTSALAETLMQSASSIERHLDYADISSDSVWIEFRQAPRSTADAMKGLSAPERIGCLIARVPDEDDLLFATAAWEFPNKSLHHAMAAMMFSRTDMAVNAARARTYFGRGQQESTARLMMQGGAYIPEGFRRGMEFHLAEDPNAPADIDEIMLAAKRDITAETVFLFAAMLMLRSDSVGFERIGERTQRVFLASEHKPGWLSPHRKEKGFVARCRKGTLSWIRPAAKVALMEAPQ